MDSATVPSWSISAAAAAVGVHPQTLRVWERKGLSTPGRSPGGTRRYGSDELARLSRIATLTGEGLNLEAILRVLELEAERDRLQREIAAVRDQAQAQVAQVHRHYRRDLVPYTPALPAPVEAAVLNHTTEPQTARAAGLTAA